MYRIAVVKTIGSCENALLLENVRDLLKTRESLRMLVLTPFPHTAGVIDPELGKAFPNASLAVHTVKSLCAEVLRDNRPGIQIMSDLMTWFALRQCIQTQHISMGSSYASVRDKRSFVREVLELMEAVSVNSISLDQIPASVQALGKMEDIREICACYREFCQQREMIPAFDAIPEAANLLGKYGQQFDHIIIYSYADLRSGEIQAAKSLAGDHAGITVFADALRCDPDSVSKIWRDSEIEYRDHEQLSSDMMAHASKLFGEKMLPPDQNDSQTVTIASAEVAVDEAEYIARTIRREVSHAGRKYADFAIVCRDVNSIGMTIRDALKKHSIPCSGAVNISSDPLVRFAFLALQVAADPHDDDAVLKWLSSAAARLDRADVYRVYTAARRKRQDFLSAVIKEAERASFGKSRDRLVEMLSVLDTVKNGLQSGSCIGDVAVLVLARSGALDEEVPPSVELFINMIRDIESVYDERPALPVILSDIRAGLAQLSDSDALPYENSGGVRIMPLSESRGMEFPLVFVPGMVGDFFPARYPSRQLLYGAEMAATRSALSNTNLPGTMSRERWHNQERDLLYIAMTAAREKLYLTFAHRYPEREDCEPSPFLAGLLGGKGVSAENCAVHGIIYHDLTVSMSQDSLPPPDELVSGPELEIACCRYIRELGLLNQKKASEALELLSRTGMAGNLFAASPLTSSPISLSSKRFSHSSIGTYLSCPRRYFFSYLLRLDVDRQPGGAEFGKLIHTVLREFHSIYPELHGHDLGRLWVDMQRLLEDVWNGKTGAGDEASGSYDAEFVHNKLQAGSYRRLAMEVLYAYLQAEHSRWEADRRCAFLEADFSPYSFCGYELTGRIDRIDECSQFGNEIIDFKTSKSDDDTETALKSRFFSAEDAEDYSPQDYQLPIYYFASRDKLKLNPRMLVVYQLRNHSRTTGEPFRRELEILPNEGNRSEKSDKFLTLADLESVKGDIEATLRSMLSGKYPPEPRDDNVCERECEFSFICEREESEDQNA